MASCPIVHQYQLWRFLLLVDGTLADSVQSVRGLGIFTDVDLSNANTSAANCFWCVAVLRRLRQIQHQRLHSTVQTDRMLGALEAGLGNAILVGLLVCLFCELQSIMNAAA